MKRLTSLLFLLLSVTLLVPAQTAPQATQAAPQAAPAAPSPTGLLPESFFLLKLNVPLLLQAINTQLPDSAEKVTKSLQQVQAVTGIDVQTIDAVWISFLEGTAGDVRSVSAKPQDLSMIALVSGRFDQQRITAALQASKASQLTTETYKDQTIYSAPLPEKATASRAGAMLPTQLGVTFLSANLVALGDLSAVRNVIDNRGNATSNNKALQDMLNEAAPGALQLAALIPASLREQIMRGGDTADSPVALLAEITSLFGSLDVASGFKLNLTMRTTGADKATTIASLLKFGLPLAKSALGNQNVPNKQMFLQIIDQIKIDNCSPGTTQGPSCSDVQIALHLTPEQWRQVTQSLTAPKPATKTAVEAPKSATPAKPAAEAKAPAARKKTGKKR